jgi:hypothetical protein
MTSICLLCGCPEAQPPTTELPIPSSYKIDEDSAPVEPVDSATVIAPPDGGAP